MNKDIDDFGFTFQTDTEDEDAYDRASQLYEMIMSFLENLKGSKDSDVINWPGEQRHEQIDAFAKKLQNILES